MSEAVARSSDALIGLEAHLLDRVDAAVMALDLNGLVLFANRYTERLLGWAPDELVGRPSSEFAATVVTPELAREIHQALLAHASWEGTFDVRRKDGSLVSVRAIDSPLYDMTGNIVGVVSVGVDATRERAVETLLKEQATIATVFRRLGETLLEHHDLGPLLGTVVDIAKEAVGATFATFDASFRGETLVRIDDVTADPAGPPAGAFAGRAYMAVPVRTRGGQVLGALVFGHDQPAMFTAADGDLLSAIATQAGVAVDNADAHASLEVEITQRRRAQEVEHFLNRCTVTLSSSLDYQLSFAALAEMAVPFLAYACLIDIAERNEVRRVAVAHLDPTKRALMDELQRNYPPDPASKHPAVQVLRNQTTLVSGEIDEDFVRAMTRDRRHREIVEALAFSSFISVPMEARGRNQGALTLVSCSPDRRFDERDIAIAQEVAHQAAIALDNARLYEDQQRARAEAEALAEQLRRLQQLSTELAGAVSVTDVAEVIGSATIPGLVSPTRGLWLYDDATSELRLIAGSAPALVDPPLVVIPADGPLPVAQVVRTGEAVYVRSLEDATDQFPAIADAPHSSESFAVVPLHTDRRVIGALALGFPDDRTFLEADRRFFNAVADQCAQALSRARLYDLERLGRDRAEADRRRIQQLNRALQTSLLPPSLPAIPGLEVSAHYQPALAGMEVGGDFYDVFDTGGDWAVVVGDVCGKGPEAAAVTATVRWTLRSIAMDIRQPAQVLRKLNEAMVHQHLDDRFCTVAYTRVVPTSQGVRLSVCRGGHPAPLVLRSTGEIESVGAPGSLIGVLDDVQLWEETTQLHPGDAFIMYTDGVTEARQNGEQFGESGLLDTLTDCAGSDAQTIGAAIEAAVLGFGGPEPSDDVAVLVLRVPV
jgi:PAS domain S-box-containing protein